MAGALTGVGKFILDLLLIPSIIFLILYALMKPIIWGVCIFIGLCLICMITIFIIKKLSKSSKEVVSMSIGTAVKQFVEEWYYSVDGFGYKITVVNGTIKGIQDMGR